MPGIGEMSVARKMDWSRVQKEKLRELSGTEDVKGRIGRSGERDKLPVLEVTQRPEDSVGRAVSDYFRALARSDLRKERPPRVPKVVLERLNLVASEEVAIGWLRRRPEYAWAFQKAQQEAALEARNGNRTI